MERQSDIYSEIADISNLISDVSKYFEINYSEISEIIQRYQKLNMISTENWISDIIKTFLWILLIEFFISMIQLLIPLIKKILVLHKIVFKDIAN